MESRAHKQIRAIRKYAKTQNLGMEMAAKQWCESGLAAKWAELN